VLAGDILQGFNDQVILHLYQGRYQQATTITTTTYLHANYISGVYIEDFFFFFKPLQNQVYKSKC
jgi:hypothetical protein